MKTRMAIVLGALFLMGGALVMAWQLAAPTQVASADAETFARANQLYANGNYGAAANLYEQLLAGGVESAEVFYNLGAAYRAAGNANGAAEMFARAGALNPRSPQMAAAANVSGIPLTQNEVALLALAGVSFAAILLVLLRRGFIFKFTTNV